MTIVDISKWEMEKFERFPIGAREKAMVWAPEDCTIKHIKSNWPYMFKESISRYPDQFWMEIVAFIVSKYLKVSVPPAYPSVREREGEIINGALIEWFYNVADKKKEKKGDSFFHGQDYFIQLNPTFDVKEGSQHNLEDFESIFSPSAKFELNISNEAVCQWLTDMALFDALIGNTDRHQQNWCIVFKSDGTNYLSPLYDNGTSLGHELSLQKVKSWDEKSIIKYLSKGFHHLRYKREKPQDRILLFDLVKIIAQNYLSKSIMMDKINNMKWDEMVAEISASKEIKCEIPFSSERCDFVLRILKHRKIKIIETLKNV